jgi:hypothetical protein
LNRELYRYEVFKCAGVELSWAELGIGVGALGTDCADLGVEVVTIKPAKKRRSGIKTPELEGVVLGWGSLPHSRCKLSGDLAAIRWGFACENRSFASARERRGFCACAKVPI